MNGVPRRQVAKKMFLYIFFFAIKIILGAFRFLPHPAPVLNVRTFGAANRKRLLAFYFYLISNCHLAIWHGQFLLFCRSSSPLEHRIQKKVYLPTLSSKSDSRFVLMLFLSAQLINDRCNNMRTKDCLFNGNVGIQKVI